MGAAREQSHQREVFLIAATWGEMRSAGGGRVKDRKRTKSEWQDKRALACSKLEPISLFVLVSDGAKWGACEVLQPPL